LHSSKKDEKIIHLRKKELPVRLPTSPINPSNQSVNQINQIKIKSNQIKSNQDQDQDQDQEGVYF
jgi:hypothetical protein